MPEITKWYLNFETDAAYRLVQFDKSGRQTRVVWVPKSQVFYLRKYPRDSKGIEIVFEVEAWLATNERL